MDGVSRIPAYGMRTRRTPAAPNPVSLLTATYARSTEGAYLTAADALAWATTNTRRTGYLGTLIEGSRTNLLTAPRDTSGTGWTFSGTRNLGVGNGPDGASLTADQGAAASGAFGPYYSLGTGLTGWYTGSCWARRAPSAGADEAHIALQNGVGGVGTYVSIAIAEAWKRFKIPRDFTNLVSYFVPWEGRALGGLTARALDYWADLFQFEAGAFASSAIRSAATRGADIVSEATFDAALLTIGGRARVAPLCSSAELIAHAAEMVIAAISTTDYVALCVDSGAAKVRLVQGGTQRAITGALTWSADQVLTITWAPSAGSITVAGATTGNGTSSGTGAAWSSGTLRIGALSDGTKPIFAHYTDSEIVVL